MTRQRVLVAVAVWLAVVAGVSALVWVVISRAGDDLSATGQTVVTTAPHDAAPGAGRSSRPRPERPSRSASGSPSSSPSDRSPTAAASPSDDTSPSTSAPTIEPTSPSPTSSPSPTRSPSSSPSASPGGSGGAPSSPVSRTWQGPAGTVVVACDGGRPRLVSAQPATGFRAEVQGEDGGLVVEFEGREDREGSRVEVVARCGGDGVPVFTTRSSGSSDD